MRGQFTAASFIIVLLLSNSSFGQAVGFGCLGFVGGYGGYSYQRYNPIGLNEYIRVFNENRGNEGRLNSKMDNFGTVKGYRVGINLFRANLEGFILTTKGFFQSLAEKHDASESSVDGDITTSFKVDMKNWGVGVDLGTSLTRALSWKVIDAALLYNYASLTDTRNYPNANTDVNKFESESWSFGYTIGTGLILEVVDDYISLEGLAGYTVFTISKLKMNETYLTRDENSIVVMPNFIDAGGFNAVIQLNIGFPL